MARTPAHVTRLALLAPQEPLHPWPHQVMAAHGYYPSWGRPLVAAVVLISGFICGTTLLAAASIRRQRVLLEDTVVGGGGAAASVWAGVWLSTG